MSDEPEESEESETSFWEDAATGAVDQALESADFDEVQGVIIIPDSTGDPRMAHYCSTIEELQSALEGLYDEQWYGNVPFEGGEALYRGDASGYVNERVETDAIENFFAQFGQQPEDAELIVAAQELLAPGASKVLRVDLEDINDELIAYLAKHPEKMRELHPRKFEELVAALFKSKGYEVTLTPRTHDGGLDVYAVRRDTIGTVMIIIECKRYAPKKKVGVEFIRSLYGVVEQKSATKGLLATTSYFTRGAKEFHNDLKYRLALADFEQMRTMLAEWQARKL